MNPVLRVLLTMGVVSALVLATAGVRVWAQMRADRRYTEIARRKREILIRERAAYEAGYTIGHVRGLIRGRQYAHEEAKAWSRPVDDSRGQVDADTYARFAEIVQAERRREAEETT